MCVELVEGKTAVYGIIGDRVEKSFSPVLQNTIGREMGVNMVYVPFKVESGQVRAAVEGGRAMNIRGFNVTVSHKIEVMDALASVDETAARIGAVNTLKLTENGYEGYNTDIIGLKKCFDERKTSLKGRNVVLAGAGGAANSAAILAGEEKAAKLVIVNRTAEKAEALEFRVKADAPLLGVPLMDLQLKRNLLVACINRNGHVIIPRGQDTIEAGDTVIVVTTHTGLNDLKDILL